MNERLLQFIWQNSLFRLNDLVTTGGEKITILFAGKCNSNAGPDFIEARIKCGPTLLVGNVEIHVKSSDWQKHGHQYDDAYKNIILHVVYIDDAPGAAHNTQVLALHPQIPQQVIDKYQGLTQSIFVLPCAGQHVNVKPIIKESWLQRLLAERWEKKHQDWNDLLTNAAGDWRNVLYWRMAANFGFKVNSTPFLLLARSLPLNTLAKYRLNLPQIEALLFGQAGMLRDGLKDEYPRLLFNEYKYLQAKHNLNPISPTLWKFLRMRPANFPTIRIAQFAALIHKSVHLFTQIIEEPRMAQLKSLLEVEGSEYWQSHYLFDEQQSKSASKRLGLPSIQNIIINTIAPIQFLYGQSQGIPLIQEQAVELIESVAAEDNNIIRMWRKNEWSPVNAAQSQALLQLYSNYCIPRHCLECSIGHSIIRRAN